MDAAASVDSYKQQVIEPGDRASAMAFQVNVESFGNCGAIEIVQDSRPEWQKEVGVVFQPHINEMMNERVKTPGGTKPKMWQIPTTDGGGHKPSIYGALGESEAFRGLGYDLVVMQDHDILRRGGMPCYTTNFYDTKAITEDNIHLLEAYFRGLGLAYEEAGVANVTGESAVVRYAVTAFCDRDLASQLLLNVAGTCIGIVHTDKYLDGSAIEPGMPIVGCAERGGRCNGFTWDIDVILAQFGLKFFKYPEAMEILRLLSEPSQSYSRTIRRVHGWNWDGTVREPLADIVAMFHITGGGIWNKLRLPPGIGAVLDNMPNPAEVLLRLQDLSWGIPRLRLPDWRAHSTHHGGVGWVSIMRSKKDADIFIDECEKDRIQALIMGKTTKDAQGEIIIKESRFKEGKKLSSLEPE